MTAVLVLSTLAAVLAVAVLVVDVEPGFGGRTLELPAYAGWRAGVALGGALVVLVLSGWVLPAVIVGAGGWWATSRVLDRDTRADDIAKVEALASWIENLRDVLVAGDQPVGAITATVATCPAAIRPPVRRLSAALGRQEPEIVFRRFADELDDPLGDLVAAGLLIAVRRGARTVGVLTSLAAQARHQADRRRLIEAERAPIRREVLLLSLIMSALVVGLFVFGRSTYLRAYDTFQGQLFLGGALVLYLALLVRVQRLARYPRPGRFLTLRARAS
jgi:hypothetical protein